MGEVRVHLDHQLGALVERLAEAGDVGAAEPLFVRAVQHFHVRVPLRQPVGEAPGPVGRVVVNDQDHVLGRSVCEHRASGSHQRFQVLQFVVGGYDDPDRPRRPDPCRPP